MLFVICDTYSVNCKRPTKKGGLLATVVCCDHLRSPQILYVCFNENLKNELLESDLNLNLQLTEGWIEKVRF